MNSVPKFKKVDIIIKSTKSSKINASDGLITNVQSTEKVEFEDCGLMISGNILIVIIDESPTELEKVLASRTTGHIFKLEDVVKYQTYKESEIIKRELPKQD